MIEWDGALINIKVSTESKGSSSHTCNARSLDTPFFEGPAQYLNALSSLLKSTEDRESNVPELFENEKKEEFDRHANA
jgi:hypothetical protein